MAIPDSQGAARRHNEHYTNMYAPTLPGLRHSITPFRSLALSPDTLWCKSHARKLANIATAEDGRSPSFDGECPSPGTATSMIPNDSNVPKDITLAMSLVKKSCLFIPLLTLFPHVYSRFSVPDPAFSNRLKVSKSNFF